MMGLPKEKQLYTVDEYLAFERSAEERHVYIDGEIFSMAGESDAHGDISVNIVGILFGQLKGTDCRVRTKDTRVRSGHAPTSKQQASGLFSYPDVLVICGEPEHQDERRDILINPKAVFEVLSPSTEAFDRGKKFTRFHKWNPMMTEYVIVSQDAPEIEHFTRQDDGSWSFRHYAGLDAVLTIESIACTLKFVDVYDRVSFENE